ncbi:hypothetical protein BA724_10445 [Domibacillus iocasae]|uniref:Uncharacterized protein n=1 Tax=Domibacillus iocasae TaxID=1714016 RepID=A0A1E7DKA5_9BACI|nr:hypothetical protein BA724_10445 [Domibacillus iocasae]
MPVNFPKTSIYSINYSALSQHFFNLPLFDDKKLQKFFIESWIDLLKKHDKILTNQFDNPEKVKDYILNSIKHRELEVFQQSLIINDVEVFIHFRVSPLLQIMQDTPEENAANIPLTEFTKPDKQYLLFHSRLHTGKSPSITLRINVQPVIPSSIFIEHHILTYIYTLKIFFVSWAMVIFSCIRQDNAYIFLRVI